MERGTLTIKKRQVTLTSETGKKEYDLNYTVYYNRIPASTLDPAVMPEPTPTPDSAPTAEPVPEQAENQEPTERPASGTGGNEIIVDEPTTTVEEVDPRLKIHILNHTKLGFCPWDLLAAAVLLAVILFCIQKSRAMKKEETELEEKISQY